jgi:hypothetical protein
MILVMTKYPYLRVGHHKVLKTAKGADQEKKPEEPKGDFPEAHKEVNYIYGGPDSYESRQKQKLTAREVNYFLAMVKWTICSRMFQVGDFIL